MDSPPMFFTASWENRVPKTWAFLGLCDIHLAELRLEPRMRLLTVPSEPRALFTVCPVWRL